MPKPSRQDKRGNGDLKGLTSIPSRIHCAATQTESKNALPETDRIIVEHFLDTLAEVAMAVARRTVKGWRPAGVDGD